MSGLGVIFSFGTIGFLGYEISILMALVPPIIVVIGILSILLGLRQSKKKLEDFDNIPLIKSTTKIFFGSVLIIFGLIQLLPLIKQI